jgi:polyisoprenoid-binding protein YceI
VGALVRYAVDGNRSSAGFSLEATLHTVHGRTGSVAGGFTRPEQPAPGGFPVEGRIVVDARSLDSGNGTRDRRMRGEILAVDRYPEIVFVPTGASGTIASFAPGTSATFDLMGNLTIRGVTRPVTLAVSASFTEGGLVADGKGTILFRDFGVPDPSNFLLRVKPELELSFHLEARTGD